MINKLFDLITEMEPILNGIIENPPKTDREINEAVEKIRSLLFKYREK